MLLLGQSNSVLLLCQGSSDPQDLTRFQDSFTQVSRSTCLVYLSILVSQKVFLNASRFDLAQHSEPATAGRFSTCVRLTNSLAMLSCSITDLWADPTPIQRWSQYYIEVLTLGTNRHALRYTFIYSSSKSVQKARVILKTCTTNN